MFFDSALFVWFFVGVFVVYWAVARSLTLRIGWLLLCSYAFYAAWNPALLSLILFSTVLDFVVGQKMHAAERPRTRKLWLMASLGGNLGLLALFKYGDFVLGSLQSVSDAFELGATMPVLDLVLPVGISFYTFQTLSYTIDIYRRKLEPIRDFGRFALFVSFFPQLVAGPIVRASDFIPQLYREPDTDPRSQSVGLWLMMLGLIKKVAIADWLAVNLVDRVFENPGLYSSAEVLAGVYGYAVQIYCDFSGYSDVAIGAALMLGFTLPENFDRPYQSANLQEFWRRWHISLSTWLRDYLYIPLGGSRHGTLMTYRNLFLTMLLGGLWHGAAWTFVVWGALHGSALAVVRVFQRARARLYERREKQVPAETPWGRVLGAFVTFHFVCFCWIFFRAPSFDDAGAVLQTLAQGTTYIPNLTPKVLGVLALGLGIHVSPRAWREQAKEVFVATPAWVKGVVLFVLAVVLQQIKGTDVVPFIYFQF